ncbi:MAG: DUF898 family protein [Pseudomonadota bacterium]
MQWYYAKDNKPIGPLSESEIKPLIKTGELSSNTLVWHRGMTDWQRLGEALPNAGIETNIVQPLAQQHEEGLLQRDEGETLAQTEEQQKYVPEFTGFVGEYFRIWVVNVFLTVVTLGIYAAWAKVRTRQYLYANTRLAGHAFQYLANPRAILKGNLIIGGVALLYGISGHYSKELATAFMVLFYLIFPFLLYKSLKFFAHNSAYRNVRFDFSGTLKESYKTYLLIPLLIPFTLGFILPYWTYRRKKYFFKHFCFGSNLNEFYAKRKIFYKYYGRALLIWLGLVASISVTALVGAGNRLGIFCMPKTSKAVFVCCIILLYVGSILIWAFMQQYLYASVNNYSWSSTIGNNLSFKSSLNPWKFAWIQTSNIIAIIFSIGLLVPWAKIRRTRYILANLTVITKGDLDGFMASAQSEENALGDVATDFFDMEIGL